MKKVILEGKGIEVEVDNAMYCTAIGEEVDRRRDIVQEVVNDDKKEQRGKDKTLGTPDVRDRAKSRLRIANKTILQAISQEDVDSGKDTERKE